MIAGMSDEEEIPDAHLAIQEGRRKLISGRELLARLVAGKVSVPMLELPVIEEGRIRAWNPATASKPDGSQWIIAFTLPAFASDFCDANPEHGFCASVDVRFVIAAAPERCGIVFNLGTEDVFQWSAAGIAKYCADFPEQVQGADQAGNAPT